MRTRCPGPAPAPQSAFAGFRFPADVLVVAVRWYLRFGLSHRDVEELLAKRGVEVDHVTVYRWVLRFMPLLAEAARPCRHQVGDRWYTDETYVKVAGRGATCTGAPVYSAVLEELLPAAWHRTDQYANNRIECDHGRLKARLRPMRGLKQDRSAVVIMAGHALVQNLRRGHYELAGEEPANQRVATAFDELALAI
jgi:IS6 family transposase